MDVRFSALLCRSPDPARAAAFWAELLGREVVPDGDALLLPGSATQIALRFVAGASIKQRANLTHLHVVQPSATEQQRVATFAASIGATPLDLGQRPDEDHLVLADPDGNEFCVLITNGYLDGTGLLGEVAGDGTREVGLFWSAVLGWPVVWDSEGETAIQSPAGGTKLAWGGPPATPRTGAERYLFELTVGRAELGDAVEQLRTGGATVVDDAGEVLLLADPDGAQFTVRAR